MNELVQFKKMLKMPSLFGDPPILDHFFDDFMNGMTNFMSDTSYKDISGRNVLMIEAPGFNSENLKVEIDENCLKIYGKRELAKDEKFVGKRTISRNYYIGPNIKDANATIKDGILTIFLTMKEDGKRTKKIEVK